MKLNKDYFKKLAIPDYILTKANREYLGIMKCTEKTLDIKYKAPDEIYFTTYMNIDDSKNPYYEAVDIMKYILLPNIGFFSISQCDTHSEGTELEYKTVSAKSYECLLGQKYLENFVINIGTVDSIDGVCFHSFTDTSHSLLHLVLEKCPEWKIGHIDTALMSMQRSFEIDRTDIYSFLMNDVSTAFECVFLFDTLNMTINVYLEENVGKDTNIHISYNNLLKNTDLACNTDDIKTCLTLVGSDDLTIREINMSQDKIYNFEYFNSTEYMSENLYNSYNKWIVLYNESLELYTPLLSSYQDYYTQINYLTNEKMPDDSESTNWEEYGLVPLQEQLSINEQKQTVMMKSGWGDSESEYYTTHYLPLYNTIQDIKAQITVVETELENLKTNQATVYSQMQEIISLVSMENNFTEEELDELSPFIREDELISDNYIVTDSMTDEERFDMLNQMLEYGQKELQKVSTPQLSFSADMANIFEIPEFESLLSDFDIANYIWITMREDYNIKTRLLEIHFDFYNTDNFKVSFANVLRKNKNRYTEVTDALKQIQSMATSVSFNKSNWSQASKDTTDINKMLAEGLLSQGNYITNNPDNSEMLIDKRGIFVNTVTGDYAYKDSIYLGGGRILFTDDNWKTVAMAVGRADINGESRFGVFADFCIASYIAGSTMEGGTITGTIFNNGNGTFSVDENGHMIAQSGEFKGDITSSTITSSSINIGNGTFTVDTNGNVVATSATIKGKIQATEGYIGGENGFSIVTGKIYSGSKSSLSSTSSGVYIGTDGISLGSKFKVDANGNLTASGVSVSGTITTNNITATGGTIGGCSISNGVLKIGNVNIGEKLTADSIDATNLKVTAANVTGTLTASQIDATNLKVSAANITGQLTASQINTTGLIAENISGTTITGKTISGGTVTGATISGNTITGGSITCDSVNISGVLKAGTGSSIGIFKVDSNSIYSGSWDGDGADVFMSTGTSGTYKIASWSRSDWAFGAGGNFGVTTSGTLYCNASYINGIVLDDEVVMNKQKIVLSSTSAGTTWSNIIKAGNHFDGITGKDQNVYLTTTAGNDYKLVFKNGILISCTPV